MDKLDAMRLFVRLADLGSFSRTASAFGISQSAVSKQLARTESTLGAQLLRRTTRGLSLTEAGQEYYDAIKQLLDGIDDAEHRIGDGQRAPSGLLRIALSASFGRMYVLPHLAEFFGLYPEVQIDVESSDRRANLITEGIDLAIRIGALPDSSMVARRIGRSECVTVGSPSYFALHGMPVHPGDASRMPSTVLVREGVVKTWRFLEDGQAFTVDPLARARYNDAELVLASALQGVGMAHAPRWLFADDLAAGRLIQVLADYAPPAVPISVVSPAGRRQPRKAQVFTEFLASKFTAIPHVAVTSAASAWEAE